MRENTIFKRVDANIIDTNNNDTLFAELTFDDKIIKCYMNELNNFDIALFIRDPKTNNAIVYELLERINSTQTDEDEDSWLKFTSEDLFISLGIKEFKIYSNSLHDKIIFSHHLLTHLFSNLEHQVGSWLAEHDGLKTYEEFKQFSTAILGLSRYLCSSDHLFFDENAKDEHELNKKMLNYLKNSLYSKLQYYMKHANFEKQDTDFYNEIPNFKKTFDDHINETQKREK